MQEICVIIALVPIMTSTTVSTSTEMAGSGPEGGIPVLLRSMAAWN